MSQDTRMRQKTWPSTHHSIIWHKVHHIGHHVPLEQGVIQMSLEDVASVQQERVRHGRLVSVSSVNESPYAAIAGVVWPASGGSPADGVKMRVDVVVVQDCDVELCCCWCQKVEEPQERHHESR